MKVRLCGVILLMATLLLSGCALVPDRSVPLAPASLAVPPGSEVYRLGVGDVISIRIFGAEEDQRFERIRLNHPGNINLPFGQFGALGRTTAELENAMTKAMKGKFLRDPRVWINIDEYRPFFVQGQVQRPGAFPYQPGLNVNKAITIAGGFRERASKDKMFIVRENDKENRPIRVDLNAYVGPGDTLTVEESFF